MHRMQEHRKNFQLLKSANRSRKKWRASANKRPRERESSGVFKIRRKFMKTLSIATRHWKSTAFAVPVTSVVPTIQRER